MSFIVSLEQFKELSRKYSKDESRINDSYNYSLLIDFDPDNKSEIDQYYNIFLKLEPEYKAKFLRFVKIYYEKIGLTPRYEGLEDNEDKLMYAILLQYFLCP